ncbi:hypothetical protein C4D60_Mb02t15170 [Musa balbisiana]|uniref:Uncharacterized protein n=1 Tax=Musa balbisiana TaxID=52838 RepID=A0A4S8ID71_MUSBA|nr:hypothetical protein C4D60_Mb02t15170 [Musa balbisiana]
MLEELQRLKVRDRKPPGWAFSSLPSGLRRNTAASELQLEAAPDLIQGALDGCDEALRAALPRHAMEVLDEGLQLGWLAPGEGTAAEAVDQQEGDVAQGSETSAGHQGWFLVFPHTRSPTAKGIPSGDPPVPDPRPIPPLPKCTSTSALASVPEGVTGAEFAFTEAPSPEASGRYPDSGTRRSDGAGGGWGEPELWGWVGDSPDMGSVASRVSIPGKEDEGAKWALGAAGDTGQKQKT